MTQHCFQRYGGQGVEREEKIPEKAHLSLSSCNESQANVKCVPCVDKKIIFAFPKIPKLRDVQFPLSGCEESKHVIHLAVILSNNLASLHAQFFLEILLFSQ